MHSISHFQSPTFLPKPKAHLHKVRYVLSPLKLFSPPSFHGDHSLSFNPKTIPSLHVPKSTLQDSLDYLDSIDWSFLNDSSPTTGNEKMKRVVDAADMAPSSRAVVCMGSPDFVDYLYLGNPDIVLSVLHYSLLDLADVKEKYDSTKCRQGDVVDIPDSWTPLDVVFINYLPALRCPLPRMFQALIKCCKPGARVIISHTQGRAQLNEHKKSYPDFITGDLPGKTELEKLLKGLPFQIVSFRDELDFYFAVLTVSEGKTSTT